MLVDKVSTIFSEANTLVLVSHITHFLTDIDHLIGLFLSHAELGSILGLYQHFLPRHKLLLVGLTHLFASWCNREVLTILPTLRDWWTSDLSR